MGSEDRSPDNPLEWLRRARSNLARAKPYIGQADIYLEDLCFDAQQAVEKAVKALLVKQGVDFPYVHDLARLVSLLEESGITIPESIRESEELSRFATAARYPGLNEPVTYQEYEHAVTLAETVVEWAEKILGEISQ